MDKAQMKRRAQTDKKTHPRKVSLTDPEWEKIKLRADRKGVSRSRYIAERTLRADEPTSGSEDILDLLFAYREAVRALDGLLDAVFAAPNEIDILLVMQRLNRFNENLLRGLEYVVGESWTDRSEVVRQNWAAC